MKYNEEQTVMELVDYIKSTYGQHYVDNKQNIQIQDVFDSIDIAEDFVGVVLSSILSDLVRKKEKTPKTS